MDAMAKHGELIESKEQQMLFDVIEETSDLDELAKIANGAHAETLSLAGQTLERAAIAGAALNRAQGLLNHGAWLPWLKQNFAGSRQTADRYRRVADRWDNLNCSSLSNLSIDKALKHLAEPEAKDVPHVSHNSGENEWYTPEAYIEAARKAMGGIDLDPASSDKAQETVAADVYYTESDNGLNQHWRGRVWMNPPYAKELIDAFIEKLLEHFSDGDVSQACVLINNATETKWFQATAQVASAICFPEGRVKFIDREGNASGAPLQGQAVLYLGRRIASFTKRFGEFGFCVTVD